MKANRVPKKMMLILMFFTIQFNIYTQEKISFTVLQDASLLVFGDHHRENAKTLDLLINIKIQGKPSQFGYFVIFPEYEKASLDKLYQRFSLNFGYTFNDIYIRNFIEPRKFEFTLAIGFGVINRFSNNSFSFSTSAGCSYVINDWIKLRAIGQLTERTDLLYRYDDDTIRFSCFIGAEFSIFSLKNSNRNTISYIPF
jgi:hypothetical protein